MGPFVVVAEVLEPDPVTVEGGVEGACGAVEPEPHGVHLGSRHGVPGGDHDPAGRVEDDVADLVGRVRETDTKAPAATEPIVVGTVRVQSGNADREHADGRLAGEDDVAIRGNGDGRGGVLGTVDVDEGEAVI